MVSLAGGWKCPRFYSQPNEDLTSAGLLKENQCVCDTTPTTGLSRYRVCFRSRALDLYKPVSQLSSELPDLARPFQRYSGRELIL
jgi:hypothetical protein